MTIRRHLGIEYYVFTDQEELSKNLHIGEVYLLHDDSESLATDWDEVHNHLSAGGEVGIEK